MLRSMLLGLLGCFSAPAAPHHELRVVDIPTLKQAMEDGRVPLLVDVRTPAEFADGHVPGAVNIPLDQLDARRAELGSPDQDLYLICRSGARSERAGHRLSAQGYRAVNVTGGTGAWRQAGLPVR